MLIGKIKEIKFLKKLIGKELPNKDFGEAGRATENMFEDDYNVIINRGKGCDIKEYGIDIKTRDLDSVSPQTIATMQVSEIISTPYEQSAVFEKFQQQIRVKTKNNIIVSAELYDFRSAHIQDNVKQAYEYAQTQLTADPYIQITKVGPLGIGHWGYFENSNKRENSRAFRVSQKTMDQYEAMTKANFNGIFDYNI